ncbi:hypothetical protein B9Z19DRAFT_302594 [Tuber borchii]|uniref:Uncharacterized protein n=1 Tax=Tuber borchii TaxID=42251 RepID=A0A2T7A545_TUBBO|nr:hypothetical protein B9Z19DRAFT_302594 [Tuber borchii]
MGFCWGNRFLDFQGFPAWEASYIWPIKAGGPRKNFERKILNEHVLVRYSTSTLRYRHAQQSNPSNLYCAPWCITHHNIIPRPHCITCASLHSAKSGCLLLQTSIHPAASVGHRHCGRAFAQHHISGVRCLPLEVGCSGDLCEYHPMIATTPPLPLHSGYRSIALCSPESSVFVSGGGEGGCFPRLFAIILARLLT